MAQFNGEDLIGEIPAYGGRGGSQQAAEHYAAKDFLDLFGRLPTKSELGMLASGYISGDPNIANTSAGKALVGQYYQSIQNSPDKVYARQQEELKQKAPQYYDAVSNLIKTGLGRDATAQEKEHFGSLLASGQLDNYQLSQFISQLPEAVKQKDADFRKQLSGELDTQNQDYFQNKILPSIQQQFLKQGRSVDSSGYASALALAAQDQAKQRENFLSKLSADQYQSNSANARADYQDVLNRYYQNQDYTRDRTNTLADRVYARQNELQDYAIQKQAYDNYLRRYGKRGNGIGSGIGTALGAGIGALGAGLATGGLGAGEGAMLGANVGGSFGKMFDRY